MGREAARARQEVRAEASLETALQVVHLHPAVAAISHVELVLLLARVDEDGVRAVEGSYRPLLAVDPRYVVAVPVVPVDIVRPIPVGDPDIPVAAVPLLVDRDPGRHVVDFAVDRERRRFQTHDRLAGERGLDHLARDLRGRVRVLVVGVRPALAPVVGDPQVLGVAVLDQRDPVGLAQPQVPGALHRAVRVHLHHLEITLVKRDDLAGLRHDDAVVRPSGFRALRVGQRGPAVVPVVGVLSGAYSHGSLPFAGLVASLRATRYARPRTLSIEHAAPDSIGVEYVLDRLSHQPGDLERQREAGGVPARLDGVHRLPRHLQQFRQVLL